MSIYDTRLGLLFSLKYQEIILFLYFKTMCYFGFQRMVVNSKKNFAMKILL